jgi:hypothetical protein
MHGWKKYHFTLIIVKKSTHSSHRTVEEYDRKRDLWMREREAAKLRARDAPAG